MSTAIESALQAKTLMPSLTVDDLPASLRFFEGLGFAVEERWEENGTLTGVMLRAGDVQIGVNQDDWKKGRDRTKGVGTQLYIETAQNIDDIAARARKAGVTLASEPHDMEMGTRGFQVVDPSGFRLTIMSKT